MGLAILPSQALAIDSSQIVNMRAPEPAATMSYRFTGYTCPPFCGTTSDGTPVTLGTAACPPDIPYGTRMLAYFNDQRLVITCHDTYGGSERHIDVWWPTLAQCYNHTGTYKVAVITQ